MVILFHVLFNNGCTSMFFSVMAVPFCTPTNGHKWFQSLFIFTNCVSFLFFFFCNGYPDGSEVVSHVILICISVMISDVKYICMYPLPIWIFSLEKLLLRSTHFSIRLVFIVVLVVLVADKHDFDYVDMETDS